jgi:hypothetical protein
MGIGSSEKFKQNVQGKAPSTGDPGSQYKGPYGNYLGDYNTPRNPGFLVTDPKELEAQIRQRNQAAYGGISSDIRETLGSAGLLGSGALPQALAGAQIGLGQQVSGDINSLYMSELERKKQFDMQRALMLLTQDFGKGVTDQQTKNDFLNQLLQGGSILGQAGIGAAFPPAAAISGGVNVAGLAQNKYGTQ